ncbi:pyridoxamine 5'-phosphate oxidase family protein [Turneriella parva]|uniref:Pyridoxamine 5'-phosphate oxidase-related, FMN-binding protein n=1 Tax=Turneriella parva (strain ATCC BAA-1111 / DSM 21527 / NCTC 11395 / H) TaxID=869212 RepID=I4B327_TURPD|nr:pyridoxamine 5'-phosphate oxidase family protein [Turneriella parva]AFM11684.1 pyridoxamine 5'-phosphate oxidase-related, FMN-binding protein [Turneriella parva DSM 21527]
MPERIIQSVSALEACVGKTPGPRDLKVIDFLDAEALRWISASPCLFVSRAGKHDNRAQATIAGGEPGFVKAQASHLTIARASIDGADSFGIGDGFGSLFVIPTQKESLRVNGTVTGISDTEVTVEVAQCYLHCAKAFMRSKLWQEYEPGSEVKTESEFCEKTRFMLVATSDRDRRADMSPKGDPAGMLLQLHDGQFWYSDRPGNRRVDGFRNILNQPQIEILALLAGSPQILRISGEAVMYAEHQQKDRFIVAEKEPLLVVRIHPEHVSFEQSAALARAKLWPPHEPKLKFNPTEIWKGHMKLSKVSGVDATLAKAAVSMPGVLQTGLDWDYKNNLY